MRSLRTFIDGSADGENDQVENSRFAILAVLRSLVVLGDQQFRKWRCKDRIFALQNPIQKPKIHRVGVQTHLEERNLENLFGDRWQDVARFNRIDRRHVHPGISLKIPKSFDDIRDYTPMPRHYQAAESDVSESDAKRILVDLSEQFLGAYEYGQLMFSGPVAAGTKKNTTPVGEFRITGYSKMHKSSLYQIEHTTEPYPMSYGLRFYINREGGSYWIHGRDLPGYPASHGCIGLYDEEMQHDYYKYPEKPMLEDARKLFAWAIPSPADRGGEYDVRTGPKVLIIDHEPRSGPRSR